MSVKTSPTGPHCRTHTGGQDGISALPTLWRNIPPRGLSRERCRLFLVTFCRPRLDLFNRRRDDKVATNPSAQVEAPASFGTEGKKGTALNDSAAFRTDGHGCELNQAAPLSRRRGGIRLRTGYHRLNPTLPVAYRARELFWGELSLSDSPRVANQAGPSLSLKTTRHWTKHQNQLQALNRAAQ